MLKQYGNTTTKFSDITIIKQVNNLINIYYNQFNVISINVDNGVIDIYIKQSIYNKYSDILLLQNNIKEHLKDNFDYEVNVLNVIKV